MLVLCVNTPCVHYSLFGHNIVSLNKVCYLVCVDDVLTKLCPFVLWTVQRLFDGYVMVVSSIGLPIIPAIPHGSCRVGQSEGYQKMVVLTASYDDV